MTSKAQVASAGKTARNKPADTAAVSDPNDDGWDVEMADNMDFEERWLALSAKDKERSRIQRQMKARRELERRRDEKRLQQQVEDWPF
jgi:hypothetical protein